MAGQGIVTHDDGPSRITPRWASPHDGVPITVVGIGRDAAEQIALLKRFHSGKVSLVAIAQQIDLATPHGGPWPRSGLCSMSWSGH